MSTPETLQLIKFVARIIHEETNEPLDGTGLTARFYDRDLFKDDPLGHAAISSDGVTEILCSADQYQTGLLGKLFSRLKEKKPDIYIEVADGKGEVLYRSAVRWDVDPLKVDEVTGRVNPTIDLGMFKYRKGKGFNDPGQGFEISGVMA